MNGLKSVRRRRDDALSQVRWQRLETLLADHYREAGYAVEHVGTGSGGRFDGGIDLKLRRDDAYIVVQCKHWNAYKVPHNVVHELLGVMVNEGATGAIVVTSGEFTDAAQRAADKLGHVELVDGDALRRMIGPLTSPERAPVFVSPSSIAGGRNAAARAADRAAARHARRDGHGLVWKVALGVFAALLALNGVRSLAESNRQRQAIAAFNAQSARFAQPDPAMRIARSTPRVGPDATTSFPSAAGAPLDPLRIASTQAAIGPSALAGDRQGVQQGTRRMTNDLRRSMRLPDPARRIDHEAARSAAKRVPGVYSVAWMDGDNLLVFVQDQALRTQSTIDAVCRELEPLGDTLSVIVNLQTRAATRGERGTTSRNCQLGEGDVAFLQKVHPTYDAPPEIMAAFRASQHPRSAGSEAARRENQRILEASTPEL